MADLYYQKDFKSHINKITLFINNYKWLIDSYLSDYFVADLPSRLPKSWWSVLAKSKPEELASLLHKHTWKSDHVWPLSLLAFRSVVTKLCLPREPVDVDFCHLLHGSNISPPAVGGELIKDGQLLDLQHCYRRHVKPKKQHEILQLGQVIRQLCGQCSCNQVVDVGAGQGHLARLLTFGLGVKVTTIEAAGCHKPKAQKFDGEVRSDISRGKVSQVMKSRLESSSGTLPVPEHIISMIDTSIPVHQFLQTLKLAGDQLDGSDNLEKDSSSEKHIKSCCDMTPGTEDIEHGVTVARESKCGKNDPTSGTERSEHVRHEDTLNTEEDIQDRREHRVAGQASSREFVLTGLHACGDLTPTMIQVYAQCEEAVGLASVGCCYMKMSSDPDCDKAPGYPMSRYVQGVANHHLSYEAREMACHFIDCYHDRLLDNAPQLHSHVYRAALQEVINDKAPDTPRGSIKLTVKHSQQLSFQQYAASALKKLKLDTTLTLGQISRAEEKLSHWCEVVAFYTIRLSLAPLVETIILLDRLLYLTEKGIDCSLQPIFNPRLSPRNFVLLANKSSKSKVL